MPRPPSAEAVVVTPELLAELTGLSIDEVRKHIDSKTGRFIAADYAAIGKLTDLPRNALYKASGPAARDRQLLDITDLESILLWLARHGKTDLRKAICGYSAQALLEEGALPDGSPNQLKPVRKSADRRRS